VGEKYALAGRDKPGITNDHFELIKHATSEEIKYDGVLRKGCDSTAPAGWRTEEYWFENLGYTEACRDGKDTAKEEGVVLLESRPGLEERTVLWHPEGWKPEIKD